jgi:phosphate transport system substrate-binding protein
MKLAFRHLTIAVAVTAAGATLAAQKVQISGVGATFPYPIYSKWFSEYNKLHSNVEINYQSLGSGAGVKQLTERTVLFGASDYPLTPEQQTAAPGKILHFPTVLGAVVPIYNIPGVSAELKFTGPLLADIFLGKVSKWNDAQITGLNAGVNLPATDITVVHRSDGSGTSYIWVDYLSKVSPEWKKNVGVAASVKWPVGVGAKGNEAVAGLVKQTPGAIGYVEPVYAKQNQIAFGSVKNAAGKFIKATPEAVTAAAAAAAGKMPADFRVSITNPPGGDVYPIASFTWLLMYENPQDKAKAQVMVDFLKWALTDGQKFAVDLGYSPLPKQVVDLEMKALATIKLK